MNIVIREVQVGSLVQFVLDHDYDASMFSGLPGDGPFATRELAEAAAQLLSDALACADG